LLKAHTKASKNTDTAYNYMPDVSSNNNLKEFQGVLNDYMQWNRRSFAEVVNQKLYFIASGATNLTKTSTKAAITLELSQPSEKYPDKTLGEVLVLKGLKARGKMPKRTSTLVKNMAGYVQKLINKRASHMQFLRAGWLPAIKKLDYWNKKGDTNSITFSKRFAPKKPAGLRQFGQDKGDVRPALLNTVGSQCKGTIYNFVGTGKQDGKRTRQILQAGLDRSVKQEIGSMRQYMLRKWGEEHARRERKGQLKQF
jgi:hypothetical protein